MRCTLCCGIVGQKKLDANALGKLAHNVRSPEPQTVRPKGA